MMLETVVLVAAVWLAAFTSTVMMLVGAVSDAEQLSLFDGDGSSTDRRLLNANDND